MVKMHIEDIKGSGKGKSAIICAHGPSLNKHKEQIKKLQESGDMIRFSPNNWFDFFDSSPDYWVLASNVDTIERYHEVMNKTAAKVFFADSVDLTSYDFIDKELRCDYFGYDQRHFKNHRCLQILKNFKNHQTKNNNFNFLEYGNNSSMWQPPFGGVPGGVDIRERCCHRIDENRKTIQETLQEFSGHNKHYSTGNTVALHMLAFAIIMNFDTIYIAGLDLDYNLGYANDNLVAPADFWKNSPETRNLVNDLQIIKQSADLVGTKIVNLQQEAWYGIFNEAENIPA